MGLELYSQIEPYLDFEEEIYFLHKQFLSFIMENQIDNILDIGCGQGYFLQNLSINSKKAFGIDLSEKQIEVCIEKGLNAKAIALEEVKEKYDCTTAIFDVINYIPKEDLSTFFKQCYEVLNKNGYFIFDVNTFFGFEEVAQGCISMDLDDRFISIDANFQEDKLYTDIYLFTKTKNNLFEKQSDTIIQEYHKQEFLKNLLKKEGFIIENIKKLNLHSQEEADKLIYFCKK